MFIKGIKPGDNLRIHIPGSGGMKRNGVHASTVFVLVHDTRANMYACYMSAVPMSENPDEDEMAVVANKVAASGMKLTHSQAAAIAFPFVPAERYR